MPQVPTGWEETTLGEVVDIIMGQSPKWETYNEKGEGIPFYQWITEFWEKFVRIKTYSSEPIKIVEPNTILFSVRAPVWKINITKHKACIGRWNAWLFMKNKEQEFLFYLLKYLEKQFLNRSSGTVFDSINRTEIENFPIQLPPLPEQQAIAAVLSSFDDKIELLRAENQTLEQMGQELFKARFGKSPNIKVWMLGDWVDVKRGSSPRPIQDYISEKGYKRLKISDASAVDSPFIFDIKECIREEGLNKTILLKSGTLVLSNSATPGIPKILAVDSCIHDGWLHFPKSRFSNEFLYLLFKEIRPKLIQQGSGSVFTNLKTDILKKYEIPIPDQETLNQFDLVIKPLFNKIRANSEQIQTLSATRDQLLPKLMSGDVRVEF